jgi:hypothetical protein
MTERTPIDVAEPVWRFLSRLRAMSLKVWSLQENCGANLVPKSANLRRLSVKICVTMRENGKSSLRLYLWDSDGFQSSDPNGIIPAVYGLTPKRGT